MADNLSVYAIVAIEEAERSLGITNVSQRDKLEDAINRATFDIETFLNRELITRGAITEFHTVRSATWELRVRVWPIISVTTVHEDTSRSYAASTLLVVDTDYIVSSEDGTLIRVSGSDRASWQTGFRAIQNVYQGGFANAAEVPHDIRGVAKKYSADIYREMVGGLQNISAFTDATGSVTRTGPVTLTKGMKDRLWPHRSVEGKSKTWERA